MRKIVALVVVILAIMSLVVVFFYSDPSTGDDIRIGAVLPLTGELAFYGVPEQIALEIAIKKVNSLNRFAESIVLLSEDSRSSSRDGAAATQRALMRKIDALITSLTIVSMSSAPIVSEFGIPQLALSVHPDITKEFQHVYRIYYGFDDEMKSIANFLVENRYERVAILWINVPECEVSIQNSLVPSLEAEGARLVASEPFNFGTTDFRPMLTRISAAKPDVVIIQDFGNNIERIVSTARSVGLTNFMGGIGFMTASSSGAAAVAGVPFVAPAYVVEPTPEFLDFSHAFTAIHGAGPSFNAVYAYDNIMFLLAGLERLHLHGHEDLLEALNSIREFEGLGGKLTVDEYRNLRARTAVAMYNDQQDIVEYGNGSK